MFVKARLLISFVMVAVLLVSCEKRELVDTGAPDFTLETLDGRDVNLYRLKGKPIILYFFASW